MVEEGFIGEFWFLFKALRRGIHAHAEGKSSHFLFSFSRYGTGWSKYAYVAISFATRQCKPHTAGKGSPQTAHHMVDRVSSRASWRRQLKLARAIPAGVDILGTSLVVANLNCFEEHRRRPHRDASIFKKVPEGLRSARSASACFSR